MTARSQARQLDARPARKRLVSLRRSRADGERGSVLVEAAFVFPILMLMLFGIIEFGVILKDLQTVVSATRSGARTAAAEARISTYDTDAASAVAATLQGLAGNNTPVSLQVYLADPVTGMPYNSGKTADEAFGSSCSHCSYFTWNSGTKAWNAATTHNWPASGSSSPISQDACPLSAGTNPNGPDTLGVYLVVTHTMFTPMFGTTKTLTDKTLIKLEPQPSTSSACQGP